MLVFILSGVRTQRNGHRRARLRRGPNLLRSGGLGCLLPRCLGLAALAALLFVLRQLLHQRFLFIKLVVRDRGGWSLWLSCRSRNRRKRIGLILHHGGDSRALSLIQRGLGGALCCAR